MTSTRPSPRAVLACALLACLGAAAVAFAVRVVGYAGVVLPLAVMGGLLLLARPRLALGLFLVLDLAARSDTEGFVAQSATVFKSLGGVITPIEALLVIVVAATAIDVSRRHELRLPDPFTIPLLLVVAAIVAGVVAGYYGGAGTTDMLNTVRGLGIVVVLPFVVVNIVRDREDLRKVIVGVGVMAGFLSLFGLVGFALGIGRQIDGGALTFYEPAPNWLLLLFLLSVLAGLLVRRRPPWPVLALAPLAFTALLLSFRRSFWIAAIAGIVLILLVATGRLGWRMTVPALLALVLAVWISLNVVTEQQGPDSARASSSAVVKRLQSLNPQSLSANAEDRYRIDERLNVWDEIKAQPISGLGIGVAWRASHPLSVEHDGGRLYVHFTALWWWLKLGILGVVGYLWLMTAAVLSALWLWRRGPDPRMRACGLGLFGGLVGLAVAETTASFTGVDEQFTVLFGAVIGFLAVARGLASATELQAPASTRSRSMRSATTGMS